MSNGATSADDRRDDERDERTTAEMTDETPQPQEPEGEAMGSVRGSDRPDPITGRPLYEGDEGGDANAVGGDANRGPAEKGIRDESKVQATGTPTSTPRQEPRLRDL